MMKWFRALLRRFQVAYYRRTLKKNIVYFDPASLEKMRRFYEQESRILQGKEPASNKNLTEERNPDA